MPFTVRRPTLTSVSNAISLSSMSVERATDVRQTSCSVQHDNAGSHTAAAGAKRRSAGPQARSAGAKRRSNYDGSSKIVMRRNSLNRSSISPRVSRATRSVPNSSTL